VTPDTPLGWHHRLVAATLAVTFERGGTSGSLRPMVTVPTCPHCGLQVIPTGNVCPSCRNDVTDLRDAGANLQRARVRTIVSDLISAGKSRAVIRRFLAEELGLTEEQIAQHIASSDADYDAATELRGPGDLILGIAFFLGGATVTAVTFAAATLRGGLVIVAYGPVIWGGYRFCVGASRFLHSRRSVRLRRE